MPGCWRRCRALLLSACTSSRRASRSRRRPIGSTTSALTTDSFGARLEARTSDPKPADTYPDPVPQCDFCRWWSECADRRRADDHLSLVAGISKSQIAQLAEWSVTTLASLGDFTLPFPAKPSRGSIESVLRVQAQARIQLQGRRERRVLHETLPVEPGLGLCRLPVPSPGDIFLDLEGDPFVGDDGRSTSSATRLRGEAGWEYHGRWALGSSEERAAFESVCGLRHGPSEDLPRSSRLPLRAVRAHRAEAPDGPLRHARGRARSNAARRHLHRPLRNRPAVHPRKRRTLLDQEPRAALRIRATDPAPRGCVAPARGRTRSRARRKRTDAGHGYRHRELQPGRLRLCRRVA